MMMGGGRGAARAEQKKGSFMEHQMQHVDINQGSISAAQMTIWGGEQQRA